MRTAPQLKILRVPATEDQTGYSRATLYRLESQGRFPNRVKIGAGQGGAIGWLASDVNAWVAARIAGREWSPDPSGGAA